MRLGATALALAVALAVVGVVSADEDSSSSWFSRLFGGGSAKTAESAKKKDEDAPPPPSPAKRLKRAQADWDRRVKVCLALKELADKLDDEELRRKANLLDLRAWDAYVATTGAKQLPNRPAVDADAKKASTLDTNTKEDRK